MLALNSERRELFTQWQIFLGSALIKSWKNLNRLPFTRKEPLRDECWRLETGFPFVSSLSTEQLRRAFKEDQIKGLFSIYQISRKKKKKSASAYFSVSIIFHVPLSIT